MIRPHFSLKNPSGIALTYFLVGISWIIITDFLVVAFAETDSQITQLQTAKGWVFVGASSILIFGLVWYGQRNYEETNDRLQQAIQQTTILQRLLRHNLRNNCNVIYGNAMSMVENSTDSEKDRIEAIVMQSEEMVDFSEKTRYLRDIVLEESPRREEIDLVRLLTSIIESMKSEYPHAAFTTDMPPTYPIATDPRIEQAITEVIENAIEHHDGSNPSISIGLRSSTNRSVEVFIADDGPGIPEMEREVLEEGVETPMFHSQGIGLWIARTIIVHAGGLVSITENEPRGTIVKFQLA